MTWADLAIAALIVGAVLRIVALALDLGGSDDNN